MLFEFTNFKFGKSWASEFNVVRVSQSDRHNLSLTPEFSDQTTSIAGRDGLLYYGTTEQSKTISLNLAFDNVTERNLQDLKTWLSPKKIDKLVFDNEPYKYTIAKIANAPTMSFLPFDSYETNNGITIHRIIYKGEINITFTILFAFENATANYYEDVEVGPNGEKTMVLKGWVELSNLLSNTALDLYNTKNIHNHSFYLDNISTTDTLYIVNSGNSEADLNISFSLLNDIVDTLTISIYKFDYGTQTLEAVPTYIFRLKKFSDYKPFADLFIGDDADWSRWEIIINATEMEIYIANLVDKTKIVNLGMQNMNQSFLKLVPISKVNYFKPFSTIISTPNNSALEMATLNSFESTMNLSNVQFEFKHKYK